MTPSEYYSKGEVNVVKITQAKLQKMKSNVTVTSFLGLVSIFFFVEKKVFYVFIRRETNP